MNELFKSILKPFNPQRGVKLDITLEADHNFIVINYFKESKTLSITGFYQKTLAEMAEVKHSHIKTIEI